VVPLLLVRKMYYILLYINNVILSVAFVKIHRATVRCLAVLFHCFVLYAELLEQIK